jgi:hypothetical protein
VTPPLAISALVAGSGLGWSAALLIDPEPLATSSAAAVAAGLVIYSVISVAGILLVHAPWSRWLGLGVVIAGPLLGIATGFGAVAVLGLILSAAAVVGLTGPWLNLWLRQRPAAGAPAPEAVALVLLAIGLTPIVGLANEDGLDGSQIALAAGGLLFAWSYARAHTWGLWGLRLAIPGLAVPATLMTPMPGAVLVGAVAAVVTVLAWRRRSAAAIGSTMALPAPRRKRQSNGGTS